MEVQLIATYVIILIAVGYTLYEFIKLFRPKDSNCGGACTSCDIKKELTKRSKTRNIINEDSKFTYSKN